VTKARPMFAGAAAKIDVDPAPVGALGTLAAAGALAGLGVILTVFALSAPIRAAIANVQGEGEFGVIVASIVPSSATGESVGEQVRAVRAEIEPLWQACQADLGPLRGVSARRVPSPTLSHAPCASLRTSLQRLTRWSDLRLAWARVLARRGVTLDVYARRAAQAPHPADPFLLPAR
jgi:hypothetical protein